MVYVSDCVVPPCIVLCRDIPFCSILCRHSTFGVHRAGSSLLAEYCTFVIHIDSQHNINQKEL
jgi:hypothetical protein